MEHERLFAEMICGEAPAFIDAEVARAARHLADLVGVMLAAAGEPSVKAVAALFQSAGGETNSARIVGTARRLSVRDAGLVNAYASHWHDFDNDETDITMAHLTATTMTAAAVIADSRPGISGAEVLEAYLIGTEVAMVIARLINPGHYLRGWHSSATLGTFAACAAAGRLLGLDPKAMRSALGTAASLASGIRSNFGTHTKPLQVGQAVANGIFAAECAAAGLESQEGSLFGPTGYVAMQEGDLSWVEATIRRFGKPYGFSAGGMIIKAYPCCTAPHSAIWGLLELLRAHAVVGPDIERIVCDIDPGVAGILMYDDPQTAVEAKFSLPYSLAAAAVFGRVGISEFTDTAVRNPAVRDMMGRVDTVYVSDLPKGPSGIAVSSRVALVLRDGRRFEKFCEAIPGSDRNPMNDEALRAKFVACTANVLSETQANKLFARLLASPACEDFSSLVDGYIPAVS